MLRILSQFSLTFVNCIFLSDRDVIYRRSTLSFVFQKLTITEQKNTLELSKTHIIATLFFVFKNFCQNFQIIQIRSKQTSNTL